MNIKCSISKSMVHEQVDFFIFRTKMLVFRINTRQSKDSKAKINWQVSRYETDFYSLRNILWMTFG